ncbi:MAG TPA: 16S rRNA (guanine(527)-N(7))-methyltransferase RsmG [Anaerolineae bacterium]|nr:16S rRNA (guanine(527)-N(7))-methyltransferase RsmG [Anaerolineae bacterium]
MKLLTAQMKKWGRPLTSVQQQQFEQYLALLIEWNQKINLTAIREPEQIEIRHFIDGASCSLVTGNLNGKWLIDVGTGAGFPGLPLKILFPAMELVLVDSVAKKTRFLDLVVNELDLNGVTIVTDRAEALGQNADYRARFDWAVGRGVAHLAILAEYLLPLCRTEGTMLAQKGERAPEEMTAAARAIGILGGGTATLKEVQLPTIERPHYLVTIPKVKKTSKRYPRPIGIPKKQPL